ncbi:sulfatase family protein [Pelagicoccus mobilis]|uniref:Sulfatase n=1 Tax=Pelagicoccus mobilis TaxID=415221 RepID=A0A934VMT2_9BACT|nr:sulfatase [Pelagicoccus mobilis]MBK1875512.1 sulfatase [Pelagicoccus mobilis]
MSLPFEQQSNRPNIVFILTDDLGYADLSCYGSETIKTPNLDRLASEGIRFTNFHQSSAQCTPSRASILTGCYPQRVDLEGVLLPKHTKGLNPDETTVASCLKQSGYATALFGKWHLGHHLEHLPTHHGFDRFYGIPYSNNMFPRVVFSDLEIVEENFDQASLTRRFTDASIDWIEEQGDTPFFLNLWHPMPHMPLAASPEFQGTSNFGLYGDVVQELDHHVGRLLDYLEKSGKADNTLVIFSSDNGPWQPKSVPDPNEGGSAYPFRGHKANEFEGGLRVPCIARWPGKIPANACSDTFWTGMDFLQTLCQITNSTLPVDCQFDGFEASNILCGKGESPYDFFFYYHYNQLNGVRSGDWKLMLPMTNRDEHYFYYQTDEAEARKVIGDPEELSIPLSLFDLKNDPSETTNQIDAYPEIADRLLNAIETMRLDLGDARIDSLGSNRRSALSVEPIKQR